MAAFWILEWSLSEILLRYFLILSRMLSELLPSFLPMVLAITVFLTSLFLFMNSMMVQSSFTVKKFLGLEPPFLALERGWLFEAVLLALAAFFLAGVATGAGLESSPIDLELLVFLEVEVLFLDLEAEALPLLTTLFFDADLALEALVLVLGI